MTVCQAISMAITVVLPAPVASLSARRSSPGFASWLASSKYWRKRRPDWLVRGATSVSQMAVSTASIWQKKGRTPVNRWSRQCRSRRAVSGVTRHWCGSGSCRHASTSRRTPLMISACCSYCCSRVESPLPSSKIRASWDSCPAAPPLPPRPRFFGLGMRRDEGGAAAALDDVLRRLPVRTELPMPGRALVRRVQDRVLEESVVHVRPSSPRPPPAPPAAASPPPGAGGESNRTLPFARIPRPVLTGPAGGTERGPAMIAPPAATSILAPIRERQGGYPDEDHPGAVP